MKRQTKFTSEEQQNLGESQTKQTSAREFSSVDEMLRQDAKTVTVPPAIEQRLSRSVRNEPKPAVSWWRRLLGS
jgi:hypothetical protein